MSTSPSSSGPGYDPEPLRTLAVSDSGFVFDPRTGHSYTVNSTGLAVLAAMKEGLPLDAIAARLREQFEAGDSVEDDLHAFVALLGDHGLAMGAGGGGNP